VQNGTPHHILKGLGGLTGYEMVQRTPTWRLNIKPSLLEIKNLGNRLQVIMLLM
jgi:hypothetical protein